MSAAITADDLAEALAAILDTEREVCIAKATRDDPAEYVTAVEDDTLHYARALLKRYRRQCALEALAAQDGELL